MSLSTHGKLELWVAYESLCDSHSNRDNMVEVGPFEEDVYALLLQYAGVYAPELIVELASSSGRSLIEYRPTAITKLMRKYLLEGVEEPVEA